ncbi:hypothetical protein N7510_006206 [Penicillium lagena]|uniref:uncharacterized protein n=1 Tax=Penicillium lagena TaxID=94218 RepID=UPI002540FCDA|nr:uncharacterized protein N7510_006206 [Penicillium lagena]KAJ5613012.1 hypothetical protein N7510_006206 [Penicillium lagena]
MHCQPIPDKDQCPLILADGNSIWVSWWSQSDSRALCPLVLGSIPVKSRMPGLDMEDQKQRATSESLSSGCSCMRLSRMWKESRFLPARNAAQQGDPIISVGDDDEPYT